MAGTLGLAWRNLGRNRRRTVITGLALAVGMSLCVAGFGLTDGMNADILRALTRLDLGHVQIHNPEFPKRRTLKHVIPHPQEVLATARALPGVLGATPRVYGFGLVSHRAKSAGVQLVGIDPQSETTVTEMQTQVRQGAPLAPTATVWPGGRALTEKEQQRDEALTRAAEAAVLAEIEALGADQDPAPVPTTSQPGGADDSTHELALALDPPPAAPPPVILGESLAKILQVKVGDDLHVSTQTLDGMAVEVRFVVRGIYRTGTDVYDRTRLYFHVDDLRRFLRLGSATHEVALRTKSPDTAEALAGALRARLGSDRLLVRSWSTIRPDIRTIIQMNDASMGIMTAIIFIVAALGVINTMLMAIFERTREIGMLKAIGMSGGRIIWMVVVETTLLTAAASLVGLGIGVALDLYLVVYGLDLSFVTEGISLGGMGLSPVVHGSVTLKGLLVPVVILGSVCFAAAFYPAIRAARMRPAQGMREV